MLLQKKTEAKIFFFTAIVFTVCSMIGFCLPSNVDGTGKVILIIVIAVWCLVWYLLALAFWLWHMELDEKEIRFRNYFGKKSRTTLADIHSYERLSNGNIVFSGEAGTLLVLDRQYAEDVLLWMNRYVKLSCKNTEKEILVIRPPRYQRVLMTFLFVAAVAFFCLCVFVGNVTGAILFLAFAVFTFFLFLYYHTYCLTVGNGYFEENVFGKKERVPYRDIAWARLRFGDNVSYLDCYIKGKKKAKYKVNLYFENAQELRELAKRMKWLKEGEPFHFL